MVEGDSKMKEELVRKYLLNNSWRIKENANTNQSFSNMQYFISSNILANDFLRSIPENCRMAHIKGLIHIHNLESGGLIPYCSGHNLKMLIVQGLKTVSISSKPAKHLDSITDQVMNFLYCSQQEFAGAQAFNDFDTLVAPFIKEDKADYRKVKQQMQKLIFNLNMTMRSANQSPFTNLSLNYGVPKYLKDEHCIVGGEALDYTYSDCLEEIYMIDRAINEIMTEKDPSGRPFTFPILTINLTSSFDWNSEEALEMARNASEVGSYYWMNYLGTGIDEDTVRSMCCRLNIRMDKLGGPHGLWNSAEGTGSLGVVTINLPRLGYDCKGTDEKRLFEELDKRLEMAIQILLVRKERIKKYFDLLMPFSKLNNWSMKNYFMTIGVLGINEMCLNYTGHNILNNKDLVIRVLDHIRDWIVKKQTEINQLINLEMVPGEGSCYRLAYIDRKECKDIKTLGTRRAPYYTTLLVPPSIEVDLWERIQFEEDILPLFTGGTIFRTYLGERAPDPEVMLDLIRRISSTKIPYFDMTTTFSVCTREGRTIPGIHHKCPECNSRTEVYSRVVGYYRSIDRWNIGKVQEFKDRKYLNI